MNSDSERDEAITEAITEARIAGTSSRALAKRYQMTSRDIEAAVDRRLDYELDDRMKLRSVKLDLARIERLFEFFFSMATTGGKDGSDAVAVSAGTLCCKLLERKALFTGTEASPTARVDIYQIRPPDAPTSYQKITDVLLSLKHDHANGGDGDALTPPTAPSGADDPDHEPIATDGGNMSAIMP